MAHKPIDRSLMMSSFKKQLIEKLWDICFDMYVQMRAKDTYLAVQKGGDIEAIKRDYGKILEWQINGFFPSPMPQKYIDSFQDEYLKKVGKILQSNSNDSDVRKASSVTGGMQDAYRFALSVNLDKTEIQTQINNENWLAEYNTMNNKPDADPNSESFLFAQGRVKGFNQILKMIREKKIDNI